MKTGKQIFWTMVVGLVAFSACNEESEVPVDNLSDEASLVEDLSETEEVYDDTDDLASVALDLEFNGSFGNKVAEDSTDERLDQPCVVKTRSAGQLVIDYGDGCQFPNGDIRAGKIIISFTGSRWQPGSEVMITFDGYSINGNAISGTRILTNLNTSTDEAPFHLIQMVAGRIDFFDGTFATNDASRNRRWIRGANPLDDQVIIEAGAVGSGITRVGISYSTEVLEDLVYRRDCRVSSRRRFVPTEGVKRVVRNGEVFTVDYGNGECDALATITNAEGQSRTVNLRRL